MEQLTVFIKKGNNYEQTHQTTDTVEIYKGLNHILISKKICGCSWVKSIKRVNLYDGNQKITVYTDNGCKYEYIIKN